MFAITVKKFGGPEGMAWEEVPDALAGPGEILIDIAATAVNRADLLQRMGFYPPPPGASEYLGLECSGTVAALGEGVHESGYAIGQQVCALLAGGGYATKVAVPAGQVMSLPEGVDVITAAALPEVAATVWSNLVNVAHLEAGDVVLIHGGAGGIGTHAVQVAKALGARVIVTAGSRGKLDAVSRLGADIGINYRDQDFVAVVKDVTDGRGADVVLDVMGAKYLGRNIDVLSTEGRLVIIGLQGGVKAELNLATLLTKRASIHATSLRPRPASQKAEICSEVVAHVWPMIDTGVVKPVVDLVVPITEVVAAHQRMEASEHIGKIILTV